MSRIEHENNARKCIFKEDREIVGMETSRTCHSLYQTSREEEIKFLLYPSNFNIAPIGPG